MLRLTLNFVKKACEKAAADAKDAKAAAF